MVRSVKLFFGTCMSACCLLAFAPVGGSLRASREPIYDDPAGYAVLFLLLDRHNPGSHDLVLELSPITASEKQMLSSLACAKVLDEFQTTAKDFHEKNKTIFRLVARFSTKSKYELLENTDKLLPPQPKPGEQELRIRSTVPLYVVPVVGFDPSKTHAIAYVSAFCGHECGGGAYHFLRKEEQGWKEVAGSPACERMSRDQDISKPQGLV